MNTSQSTAFYDLYQLSSCRETLRQKEHRGVFPWSARKIRYMVEAGEFPAPIKNCGKTNWWRASDIDAFIKTLSSETKEANGWKGH